MLNILSIRIQRPQFFLTFHYYLLRDFLPIDYVIHQMRDYQIF